MVSREQVIELYRLILDRDPESEAVINEKRKADNAVALTAEMLTSDEFFIKNREVLRSHFSDSQI